MRIFAKSNKPNLNAVNSIIASDMHIEGAVVFTGTLKISGHVAGDVFRKAGVHDRSSTVIIDGSIHGGTIEADHVIITGRVTVKKIVAHGSLIVLSGGYCQADEIFYRSITSDDTVVINGKLEKITDEMAAEKAEQ